MGLKAALLVHVEPLVERARVLVVGDDEDSLVEPLRELGARDVVVTDSVDLETRANGSFDLVLITDLGRFEEPAHAVRTLRRSIASGGALVAVARANTDAGEGSDVFPEIAPAVVSYDELYGLFARDFDAVSMTGVLSFEGVVFAELGAGEEPNIGVDGRLAPQEAPSVFVVVASDEAVSLEPYAIVQVPPPDDTGRDDVEALEAALSQAMLEAKLLTAQLEEQRQRNARIDARSDESRERLEELAQIRDAAMNRVVECEAIALASQLTVAQLEKRLALAEEAILERDDAIAALRGELDALRSEGEELASVDPAVLDELTRRAERAEAAMALNIADLGHVAEAHASETATLEARLRERGEHIASLEKEMGRREQLVRELVGALEESREGTPDVRFESAPPLGDSEEIGRLKKKLDELALEVAKRDGELVTQAWRIEELEGQPRESTPAEPVPSEDLARARDEIDALRQALTQEHAARIAAESGEELVRARAELAQKAALLEQIKGVRS